MYHTKKRETTPDIRVKYKYFQSKAQTAKTDGESFTFAAWTVGSMLSH